MNLAVPGSRNDRQIIVIIQIIVNCRLYDVKGQRNMLVLFLKNLIGHTGHIKALIRNSAEVTLQSGQINALVGTEQRGSGICSCISCSYWSTARFTSSNVT